MNTERRQPIIVPEWAVPAQNAFIARVYLWMTAGLVITTVAALYTITQESLLQALFTNRWLFYGLLIAELALVWALTRWIGQLSFATAAAGFVAYAALNGVTLSLILLIYTESSIVEVFGLTAVTFMVMGAYGYFTKRDLTRLGNLLLMALVGLILASLFNIFFNNAIVYWITTFAGILIFVGLVAYDTQKLKRISAIAVQDAEASRRVAIVAALSLYLDFINLFLLLLRLFGKRR